MKETGIAEIKYQTVGLADLEKGALAITGLNQGLQLAGKAAEAASKAFEVARKAMTAIISEGAEYERFQGRFTTLLGSMEAGKRRMEEIERIGGRSGFAEASINRAAVLLETHQQYSERALRVVMDAAAATGTELEEVAQTIGMAAEGNLRGLRQYGVGQLDIVSKMGHEVRTETQKDIDDITSATIQLLEERMGGGMERFADTWDGMVGRLTRKWDEFKESIAQAGPLEAAKGILSAILGTADRLDGKIETLAETIGKTLADAMWDLAESIAGVLDILTGASKLNWEAVQNRILLSVGFASREEREAYAKQGPPLFTFGPLGDTIRETRARMGESGGGATFDEYGVPSTGWGTGGGGQSGGGGGAGGAAAPGWIGSPEWMPGAPMQGPRSPFGGFGMLGGITEMGGENDPVQQLIKGRAEALKAANEEHEAQELAMLDKLSPAWNAYYNSITRRAAQWKDLSKINLKDILGATKDAIRSALGEYVAGKAKEAMIEGGMNAAKAIAAWPNVVAMAKYAAASAGYFALAGTVGAIGAGIASSGRGAEATAPMNYVDQAGGSAGNGSRSISRTAGVSTQNLNVNVYIIHNDAVVYGRDGLDQLVRTEMFPAISEGIAMGAI